MDREFIIGGVAYSLQVRAEHAVTLAELAYELAKRTLGTRGCGAGTDALVGYDYAHTSVLPEGRFNWLKRACLDTRANWAITIDADTWIKRGHAWELLDAIPRSPRERLALVGVLVPCRDGRVNAWSAPGRRLSRDELASKGLTKVESIGLAIAAYHLPWYRERLSASSFCVVPSKDGGEYIGEDVWHCRWVADQGGEVYATGDVPSVHGASTR